MSDAKADALGRVPLFSGLRRKELEYLTTRTDEVRVDAGRTLLRQGESGDGFYVLLEGEADVEVDGRPRPMLRAGDFFGEISMLDRGPATATIITRSPARLMVMSHAQFRDAVKANDQILLRVLMVVAERLRRDDMERKATPQA